MISDEAIIEAVLAGDLDRYAELVERYRSAAWKIALGFVRNPEDAKELSQNGFVKAYQQLRQFQGKAKFSTWLYRIIANECKDFLRRKARAPKVVSLSMENESEESVLFELADSSLNPSESISQKEQAKTLAQAIGRLPMKQQTAFILRHVNGLSIEEVSQIMGSRSGTVKSHLFRATEALRVAMEPLLEQEAPR